MPLEVYIQDAHFIVKDKCKINSSDSNVINNSNLNKVDRVLRESSFGPARGYLFYINIACIKPWYELAKEFGRSIDIQCPICNKTYHLGELELKIAVEEYQRLTDLI